MRVVIDGLPLRGLSVAIVIEHLMEGWLELDNGDELHLVTGPEPGLTVPAGVIVHEVALGRRHYLARMRAQATVVPRLCRELNADVMLGVLPSTTITPLPCPRAMVLYDLRYELRPQQFTTSARLIRKVSYEIGFHQADAIVCISERTRDDLLQSRSWLAGRIVRAAQLGADHVDGWVADDRAPARAIAFGQWGNKNVEVVVDAWRLLADQQVAPLLDIVGLRPDDRAALDARLRSLGLSETVTTLPWLSDEQFRGRFASASMVVFPSDFEGFGLPAVEAMRLGIPVVVTPDPALLEVTGGHAAVMDGWGAPELADAVLRAGATTAAELAKAREHAAAFTWSRMAAHTRAALAEAIQIDKDRR